MPSNNNKGAKINLSLSLSLSHAPNISTLVCKTFSEYLFVEHYVFLKSSTGRKRLKQIQEMLKLKQHKTSQDQCFDLVLISGPMSSHEHDMGPDLSISLADYVRNDLLCCMH